MNKKCKKTRRAIAGLLSLAVLAAAPAPAGAASSLPFSDVAGSSWYADAVSYVCENSLMTGTGADTFQPAAATNRAMLVTILHRIDGEPESASKSGFYDVSGSSWYSDPVDWAAGSGIVTGYDGNVFRPGKSVTRQEMVTILYRYAQYSNRNVTIKGSLSAYSDYDEIQNYALRAMSWAAGNNIITGKSGARLDPGGTATRAEIAAIIMRYCKLYGLTDKSTGTDEPEENDKTTDNTDADKTADKTNDQTDNKTDNNKDNEKENEKNDQTDQSGQTGQSGETGAGTGTDASQGSDSSSQGSSAAAATETNTVTAFGYDFYVGMSKSELPPMNYRLSVQNLYGGRWRIYMPNEDFNKFVMLHITDAGVIDEICAIGREVSFMDIHPGDQPSAEAQAAAGVYSNKIKLVLDTQGDGSVAMIILGESAYYDDSLNADPLWEECYLSYYCLNAFRVQKGLSPLSWSDEAADIARAHSQDMSDNNYFSHTSLDGTGFGDRLRAGGISFSKAAENIALNQDTGIEVLTSWIHSAGHRTNILNADYTHIGVGGAYGTPVYSGGYVSLGIYWTQEFYTPK